MEQMNPDRRLKLVDILVEEFTADELRGLVYTLLGAGAYQTLGGTSKVGTATGLLERLESAGRVEELVNLVRERRPNIDLSGVSAGVELDSPERTEDTDRQEYTEPASSSTRRRREVSPQFAARIRDRRPGYDRVNDLVSKYDALSSDERAQVSHVDMVNSYIQPMFEALGWSVSTEESLNAVRGVVGSRTIRVDLLLTYRNLRVLAEVKRPRDHLGNQVDDQLVQSVYQTGNSWGLLTNFETIRVLDLRYKQPTLLLETNPWLYVTDEDEEHDLLAAAVFYNRFAPRSTRPQSVESLVRSLEDNNDSIRQAAIEALGRLGDPQAVESLIPILDDSNESIRLATVVALGEIGDPRAIEGLSRLRQDPNDSIRLAAVQAIGKIEQSQSEKEQTDNLAEQVRQGTLSPGAALDQALQISDAALRIQVLEGVAPYLPEDAQEQVQAEIQAARAAAAEALGEVERRERIEIAVRALADKPSDVDLLGFSDYAEALADFVRNEKTEKPLTIGINASWGMGKTTLMLMIRDQLTSPKDDRGTHKQTFPTVWFNAWKYDQEESLWAALALQILAQVRKQFNWRRRAQLWAELNYKRIDRALLGRSVLKLLAYVTAIYLLGAVFFGIVWLWLGTDILLQYVGTIGILGFTGALYAAGKEIYDRVTEPFNLKLTQYIRESDYEERVGFLAQFEDDFKRVIDVVTKGGKRPLVVFIDDLDRCAPPKPAEIIEAINILLDAKHCVFVIGMDAQAVAGSIQAKYESLQSYLDDADDPGGLTLGQRFLEKIVQINFRIPRADPRVIESFIDANLELSREAPTAEPLRTEVREAKQLIDAEQRAGRSLDEAVQVVQMSRSDIPREALTEAREEVFAQSFDDAEEVRRAIHEVAPYLEFNPRKIKRFINGFRLQALIANRRGLLESGIIQLDLLARWVVVATRWPDFIEAVSDDESFIAFLIEAHDIQRSLVDPRSARYATDKQRKDDQARIDFLLTDPRIRQWVDAADLTALLKETMTQPGWQLSNYLHLVQTVSEGRLRAGGTGLP